MLQRHKIPTIFNIYMLDVICCALGCVVLLWQVAHQEAEEQTDSAKQQSAAAVAARLQYETAKSDLLSASSDVSKLHVLLAEWKEKHQTLALALGNTKRERDEAALSAADRQKAIDKATVALALHAEQLKKLQDDLAKLLAEQKKTEAQLTGTVKLNTELLLKIVLAEKQVAGLKDEIRLKQADAEAQGVALKLSDDQARKLQKLLDSLKDESKDTLAKLKLAELRLTLREQDFDKARKDFLDAKDKYAKDLTLGVNDLGDAKKQIATLAKELDSWKAKGLTANAELGTLRLEKDKLTRRVSDLQIAVDQRFAGIPLTGENVVFLIDISGSMSMKDETTEDPDKWPFLCETLMKLMKSIPTLQRFQVILFSDKTTHLFGNRDLWLKYEGPESAKMTADALRKVKVEGGTNMHGGFDEAFRYRKIKLDTIYLFSDGLPNLGPGLPSTIRETDATEAQRNLYRSKFVRDKLKNEWNRPEEGTKEVRINAVGFFFESPDVGAFLWAMAREHRGSFVGLR